MVGPISPSGQTPSQPPNDSNRVADDLENIQELLIQLKKAPHSHSLQGKMLDAIATLKKDIDHLKKSDPAGYTKMMRTLGDDLDAPIDSGLSINDLLHKVHHGTIDPSSMTSFFSNLGNNPNF